MGMKSKKMDVQGSLVAVVPLDDSDYISLTDIARHKSSGRSDDLIRNWLRNRNTLEFIGVWEQLNNPNFKPVEFDGFRKQSERLIKFNKIAIQQMHLLSDEVNVLEQKFENSTGEKL